MIMFKIAIWVDIMTFNLLNEKPTGANFKNGSFGVPCTTIDVCQEVFSIISRYHYMDFIK